MTLGELLRTRWVMDVPNPPREVADLLRHAVRPRRRLDHRLSRRQPFSGVVGDDAFEIELVTVYWNSFKAVLRGRIRPRGNGTRIEVRSLLSPGAIGVLSIWIGMSLLKLAIDFCRQMPFEAMYLYWIAIPIVLIIPTFVFEMEKGRRHLQRLLKSECVE